MSKFTLAVIVGSFFFGLGDAGAAIVTFDFAVSSGSTNQAGSDLDGLPIGMTSLLSDGVTITLSASANTGVMNANLPGGSENDFGINATGGDITDAFDGGAGVPDVMTLSFTPSIASTMSFVSIDFDRISGSGQENEDRGGLSFVGGSSLEFHGGNTTSGGVLSVNESFTSGQTINLSWIDGGGFGLERITLDVTAVPEPTSAFGLIVSAGIVGVIRRRRHKRHNSMN